MATVSLQAIQELPKVDLHSHIDGSVPIRELFRIARLRGKKLLTPQGSELTTAASLAEHVRGSGYETMLDDIVNRFYPITRLMQTQEVLRDVGVAYAKTLKDENVMYAEGRFAPQYHLLEGLTVEEVIQSMQEGLAEGSERFGVKINLIAAIGRESDQKTADSIARAASSNRMVVALDLGGPEVGNPPEKFTKQFALASAAGLKKTIHAGEGAGSTAQNLENIRTAVAEMGADRIGHAIDLVKDEELTRLAVEKRVSVEMNPRSNVVLGKIKSPADLGIDRLLKRGVSVTVNSDDPALWTHGGVAEVIHQVCRSYHFGLEAIDSLVSNAVDGAFIGANERKSLHERYAESRKKLP